MKKIIFILLIAFTLNAQSLFEGKAGDVWHLTGSTLLTLTIDRYTDYDWGTSAAIAFSLGFMKEIGDHYFDLWPFDPAGFSERDLIYDGIGVLLSYPLRYKNCQLNLSANHITLRVKL